MALEAHFSEDRPSPSGFEAFVLQRDSASCTDSKNCTQHVFVPRRVEAVVDLSRLASKVAALPETVAGIDDRVWKHIREVLEDPLHVYETRAGRFVVALRGYAFCILWGRAKVLVGRHISDELHFAESIDGIAFAFSKIKWAGVLAQAVVANERCGQTSVSRKAPMEVIKACLAALHYLRRLGVLRELRRCVRQALGMDRDVLRLAVRARAPWRRQRVRDAAYELAHHHRNTLLKIERETPAVLPLVFYAVEEGVIDGIHDGAVGAVKRKLRAEGISDRAWRALANSKTHPFRTRTFSPFCDENWPIAVQYCRWLDILHLEHPIPPDLARAITSRNEPDDEPLSELWVVAQGDMPLLRAGVKEYWRRSPEERERFIADEFLLVADYYWMKHPKLDPNQRRAGWQWLLKRARLWAETVRIMKRCSALSWQCPIQRVKHGELIAVALATPLDLWEEAQALRHCAAIYDEKCVTGDWLVYSIRDADGKQIASAAIKRDSNTRQWVLETVRQFANSVADAKYARIARKVVRALNRYEVDRKTRGLSAAERMDEWLQQMTHTPIEPMRVWRARELDGLNSED